MSLNSSTKSVASAPAVCPLWSTIAATATPPLLDSINKSLASSSSDNASDDDSDNYGIDDDDCCCMVCFGVYLSSYQRKHVLPIIEELLQPYCAE